MMKEDSEESGRLRWKEKMGKWVVERDVRRETKSEVK